MNDWTQHIREWIVSPIPSRHGVRHDVVVRKGKEWRQHHVFTKSVVDESELPLIREAAVAKLRLLIERDGTTVEDVVGGVLKPYPNSPLFGDGNPFPFAK